MIFNIHFMILPILVKSCWSNKAYSRIDLNLVFSYLRFLDILYQLVENAITFLSFNTFIYIFKEVDYYTGHVIHNSMTLILNCRIAQRHIQSLCVQKTFWCQLHSLLNWALEAIHCVKIPLNFFYVVITYFN